MKLCNRATHILLAGLLSFTGIAYAGHHHDSEKAQICKRAVMTETREFKDIPMAGFSQAGHHHSNLLWTIHWEGKVANGSCKFHDGNFLGVNIDHHLKHHGEHAKSEKYKGTYGGFYYDRHIGKWRDPEGKLCHTCTPENGFPKHGG